MRHFPPLVLSPTISPRLAWKRREGKLNTLCPYSRLILENLSSAILIVQTGVEVAGELTDFIKEDLMRLYPQRAQAMR